MLNSFTSNSLFHEFSLCKKNVFKQKTIKYSNLFLEQARKKNFVGKNNFLTLFLLFYIVLTWFSMIFLIHILALCESSMLRKLCSNSLENCERWFWIFSEKQKKIVCELWAKWVWNVLREKIYWGLLIGVVY